MTELIWEGKYDDAGRKVAPLRVALPFQTVETVNESAQERQKALDLWTTGRDTGWRNRLIWGDKKYVLPSLLQEFAGKVDLIYIDPPFDTGSDFSFQAQVGDDAFTKAPSVIEMKAYRDTWGRGRNSYLQWFYDGMVFLCELLSENGSLYVHIGQNVVHYVKCVLDELLPDGYLNEIIWKRTTAHSDVAQGSRELGRIHDVILRYAKGPAFKWHPEFTDYDEAYLEKIYRYVDADGRRYQTQPLHAKKPGGDTRYDWKGQRPPPGRYWAFSRENMEQLEANGMIVYSSKGVPRYKIYLDESKGRVIQDMWDDIGPVHLNPSERVGYETQKPVALIERIINLSTDEDDLVLDCFVGSGTTAVAAESLRRRWMAVDLGRFAIHTTRKRLLDLQDVRPFVVQNLGKYERQLWQAAEFGEAAEVKQAAYRQLILDLYHATPINGYSWLHGVKGGRMIHVGAVDSPISLGDITQIAGEFKRAVGTGADAPKTNGVDVLGWDFAFELNEVAKQKAAEANVDIRFLRIPHDVMDKRARDQGDIRFFELAALSVESKLVKQKLTLTLTDFVIPPDDVPEDIQRAITKWDQWIDYWAVDWDNKGDTFHNQWQDYRTRKKRDLLKTITHTYEQPGEYVVAVKVIDILGNDTTKTLKVAVK